MKQSKFSESQIVAILKQQDSGQTVAQITREHGVSEATFYNRSGGPVEGQVRWDADLRSKAVERLGRRKSAIEKNVCRVEFTTRNHKGSLAKKGEGPAGRRALVEWMIAEKRISQRKACRWVGLTGPPVRSQRDH